MESEIELRQILQIIRRRFWIIALITFVAVLTSGIYSYYILTPIYKATTTMMVIKKESPTPIDYTTVMLNRQLVKTYGRIAQSRTVAEEVIRELDLTISPGTLQGKIKVSPLGDTEIIQIDVEDESPVQAQAIANKVAEVFIDQIGTIMQVENVNVIDPAVTPHTPVRPRPKQNIAIAGALGLMVSLGLAFLLEYLDNTIKTPEDVTRHLGLPVLGAIPRIDANKELKRVERMQRRETKAAEADRGVDL